MDKFIMQDVVFIVEGRNDKLHLQRILPNNAIIVCTNGTVDEERMLDILEQYEELQFITLFDADKNGEKLRKIVNRIYPEAIQLTIDEEYRQVEETPLHVLTNLLQTTIIF